MKLSISYLKCLALIAFSSIVTCRTVIKQPPWIRPEPMPEILYEPGAMPKIIKVLCPTISAEHINVTWWRGSELVSAGEALLFRPLGSHHIGKYHCEAKSAAGLSRSGELEVNEVILQRVTPIRQRLYLMEGQAASIPCPAPGGYPTPVVRWNSTKSDFTTSMIVDPEGTLHIPSVETRNHGSTLRCSIEHLAETHVIKTVELIVYPRPRECIEDPRLLYATQSIYLRKQSDCLIYCVTSGSSSSISWTVHLHDAKAAFVENSKYSLRINSSTLAVKERSFQVTCQDTGSDLKSVVSVTLASEPNIHPMRNVSKLEGEEVLLKCYANGIPKPTVEWFFNNEPVRRRKLIGNDVVLPNVTLEDMGVYRCEAFNQFGRTYRELTLSVNRAEPHILADTDCYESVVGDRLLIPCNALAFREPVRKWSRNGVIIDGKLGDESLELIDVQLDDSGHYACEVCEKENREIACSLYEFKVKISSSQLLETPQKPIVVLENGALNISCIPRFADDVILWRIDDRLLSRGRTLYLEKPQAGTYSCELSRNSTLVTRWDGAVSLRKPPPKIRIREISCRGEGVALLHWTPAENVAFYEILHLYDSKSWRSMKFITSGTATSVELSHCSPCLFRVRSHDEAGSITSETQQCSPPRASERENIRLLLSNITVNRKANGVHLSWSSSSRKKLCLLVCAHPQTICQETFGTNTSFSLNNISLKSSFSLSSCGGGGERGSSTADSINVSYNCSLILEITDIRQVQRNSVDILWDFVSDPCCSLAGHLEVDDSRRYPVDLDKKRFRLEKLERNRMYCLKLRASHGDRDLLASATSESCFVAGQGWEPLREDFSGELPDSGRFIPLPNNTIMLRSNDGRFEPSPRNVTLVDVEALGKTSIKFVQRENGYCRVSNVLFLNQDEGSDWYLWLCAVFIVVGGVAITAVTLLRKRSRSYAAELI